MYNLTFRMYPTPLPRDSEQLRFVYICPFGSLSMLAGTCRVEARLGD